MSKRKQIIGIYKILSPSNRVYIGQSLDIYRRWTAYDKINNTKKQVLLYNSFVKYGVKNHQFEIIHVCEPEELNNLEIYYGELFNCINPKFGLNSRVGDANGKNSELSNMKNSLSQKKRYLEGAINGMTGVKPSAELIKKRVDARKGYRHSDETKRKIGIKHKGKKGVSTLKTDEQRIFLSETLKKVWAERKVKEGVKVKETKYSHEINLRKGRKGELHSWWGKGIGSVLQYNKEGLVIGNFVSASQAARGLNIQNGGSNILKCCNKKIPSAYGYKWEYKI